MASISLVQMHPPAPSVEGSTCVPSSQLNPYHTWSIGCEKPSPYLLLPPHSAALQSQSSSTCLSMATDEVQLLQEENAQQKAEFEATLECKHHACELAEMQVHEMKAGQALAEAHATIQKLFADDLWCQVTAPRKAHKVNIHSCLLTCPEAQEAWEKQQAIEDTRLAQLQVKADQQTIAMHARTVQCIQNAILKTFDLPFHCYKHKDDLCNITITLTFDDGGCCINLQNCIKTHLEEHLEIQMNPHLVGLYAKKRQRASCRTATASDGAAPASQAPSHHAPSTSQAPSPAHSPPPHPAAPPHPVLPCLPTRTTPFHAHAPTVRPQHPALPLVPYAGYLDATLPESLYVPHQRAPSFGGVVAPAYSPPFFPNTHPHYGATQVMAAPTVPQALPGPTRHVPLSLIAGTLGVPATATNCYVYPFPHPQHTLVAGVPGVEDHTYGSHGVMSPPSAGWGYPGLGGTLSNLGSMHLLSTTSPTNPPIDPSIFHPFTPHTSHADPFSSRSEPTRRGGAHSNEEGHDTLHHF
ncbi:hypothetical protein K439DRAFT_1616725 [Ramaria rubella]|nr:hypothetical protein K439DRAFT_1616725 [Ramaria rubella]